MKTTYVLEHPVHFISEEWTESYKWYDRGRPKEKNVLGAQELPQGSWLCGVAGGSGA